MPAAPLPRVPKLPTAPPLGRAPEPPNLGEPLTRLAPRLHTTRGGKPRPPGRPPLAHLLRQAPAIQQQRQAQAQQQQAQTVARTQQQAQQAQQARQAGAHAVGTVARATATAALKTHPPTPPQAAPPPVKPTPPAVPPQRGPQTNTPRRNGRKVGQLLGPARNAPSHPLAEEPRLDRAFPEGGIKDAPLALQRAQKAKAPRKPRGGTKTPTAPPEASQRPSGALTGRKVPTRVLDYLRRARASDKGKVTKATNAMLEARRRRQWAEIDATARALRRPEDERNTPGHD